MHAMNVLFNQSLIYILWDACDTQGEHITGCFEDEDAQTL